MLTSELQVAAATNTTDAPVTEYYVDYGYIEFINNYYSDTLPITYTTFCGKESPGVLTSSNNILHLNFKSDRAVTNKGFHAKYYTVGWPDTEIGK